MRIVERTIQGPHGAILLKDTGGEGLPLVMLHGSGSSSEVFARQLESPTLAGHRLVALDLPGHGRSADAEHPEEAYTVRGLAETVATVLERLRIGNCAVFGWSLGGHVAIELAARLTTVRGLFLVGTPPVTRGPLGLLRAFQAHWDLLLASKVTYTHKDAVRFERLCFDDTGHPAFLAAIERADGRMRSVFLKSLMRGDGTDQKRFVETTDIPVAVLNGATDPFVRLGYMQSVAYSHLWRQRCHVIPGVGHTPFWYGAELVNPLLAAFARDVAQAVPARRSRTIRVA